ADGHRGFCLEFDSTIEPFSKALPVSYLESFPYINPVDILVEPPTTEPENSLMRAAVLTKTPCSRYEEEWRLLPIEANKLYTYDHRALTGVYLGAAMPFPHQEILFLILRGAPTRFYEVKRDERAFNLVAKHVTYTPFDYGTGSAT